MGNITWLIIIALLAVIIFIAAIRGSGSNRRRISDDIDRAGRINTGLGKLGDSERRTKEGLEELEKNNSDAQRRSDDISKHNKSSKNGIRSAIDILKNAKNRTNNKGS